MCVRRVRVDTKVLGICVGVVALCGMVLPLVRGTALGPPWTTPWNNESGWGPCSVGHGGTQDSRSFPSPDSNAKSVGFFDEEILAYFQCSSDTLQRVDWGGDHAATLYQALKGSSGTYSSYTFSFTWKVDYWWMIDASCNTGSASEDATMYGAIWDTSTGINAYGNVYDDLGGVSTNSLTCSGGTQSASGNVYSNWTFTATSVQLYHGDYYQPRGALQFTVNVSAPYAVGNFGDGLLYFQDYSPHVSNGFVQLVSMSIA